MVDHVSPAMPLILCLFTSDTFRASRVPLATTSITSCALYYYTNVLAFLTMEYVRRMEFSKAFANLDKGMLVTKFASSLEFFVVSTVSGTLIIGFVMSATNKA